MFTGIITNITEITKQEPQDTGLTLTFKKPEAWHDLELGESIATDGVCLTVAEIRADNYQCHLVPETLSKTTFGRKLPDKVNLERSLSVSDRFGGHFVQGHVDGLGQVTKIDKSDGYRLSIKFSPEHSDLVIYKGSITINGVALTVTDVGGVNFSVALVPHTLEHTTLASLVVGASVNLEFDMIGKYIVRIMNNRKD